MHGPPARKEVWWKAPRVLRWQNSTCRGKVEVHTRRGIRGGEGRRDVFWLWQAREGRAALTRAEEKTKIHSPSPVEYGLRSSPVPRFSGW